MQKTSSSVMGTPLDTEKYESTEALNLKGPARKTAIFTALLNAGFPAPLAHSVANNGKPTTRHGVNAAKRKSKSYALARPQFIKLAETAIKETLEMKPIEVTDKEGKKLFVAPTISNRLDASKMIMDRADPVHQVHEHHTMSDYGPLDMSRFEVIPREKVIDQAPESANSEQDQQNTV